MTSARGSVLFVGLFGSMLVGDRCSRFKTEPWETAPLARGEIEVVRLEDRSDLIVERVRFHSEVMDSPRFFLSLMPATARHLDRVLIVNHGWWDRPEDLLRELKVDLVYGASLASGKVAPALVVLPDVRFGDFYRRHRDRFPFPVYLTLVAEEVAKATSEHYRIPFSRDKWSIGGFSFGGYLSLDVARRYPGRFGSVSVVSAFFEEEWSFWPASPPDPGRTDDQGRGKHTVVEPGPIPRILLACGTDDRLFDDMVALHELFDRRGIPHPWLAGPGAHTWEYWASVIGPMLEFHLGAEAEAVKGE